MIKLRDDDVLGLFVDQSDTIDSMALVAATEQTRTVPSGAKLVVFEGSDNFFYKNGATAAVPGDITNGAASEQNPRQRSVAAGDVLHFIASADCVVTLAYYG